ncbi:MAG: hypothetical protein FJ011_28275 [Chloroflexi bacterium]|nr:hypothetical protein [Chloroflexota bacterium]
MGTALRSEARRWECGGGNHESPNDPKTDSEADPSDLGVGGARSRSICARGRRCALRRGAGAGRDRSAGSRPRQPVAEPDRRHGSARHLHRSSSYGGLAECAGQIEPLSLAAADFDRDGVPDLAAGYASSPDEGGRMGAGILTLRRGNVDAIYPTAPRRSSTRRRPGTPLRHSCRRRLCSRCRCARTFWRPAISTTTAGWTGISHSLHRGRLWRMTMAVKVWTNGRLR